MNTREAKEILPLYRGIEPPPGLSEQIVRKRPIRFPRDWPRIG